MIEELTPGKLREYGFEAEQIRRVCDQANYEAFRLTADGNYFAAGNKIFSGIDALKKYYLSEPRLILPIDEGLTNEESDELLIGYFSVKRRLHLAKKQKQNPNLFMEEKAFAEFKDEELQYIQRLITALISTAGNHFTNRIERLTAYLHWLNSEDAAFTNGDDNAITIETKLRPLQLPKLHRALFDKGYISKIPERDFCYMISGKPYKNHAPKIKWLKTKAMLIYLLDCICLNLNLTTANKCIATKGKGLDSNSRGRGYNEIDVLLKTL